MRADLALIGFGNVGRRFVRLIQEQRERLAGDYDLDWRVLAIATRRHGSIVKETGVDVNAALGAVENDQPLGSGTSAGDARDGVTAAIRTLARSAAPLRVVVEATTLDIREGQPAIDHVIAGLDAGCHVVTANKGPVAFAYHELREHARRAGVSFLFEGAVMDGIPVFNLVRETLPAVNVMGFRGVVNSTTNHVITAIEAGESFESALARMQSEGIAEADPSLDMDGWDAAAKTAALANVLMDARITPRDVDRAGIDADTADCVREALRRGLRLKLVASAQRLGSGVRAVVRPEMLPQDDVLAGLRGTGNAIVLRTDMLGEIAICQLEGSLTATAYALLSDLVTVRRRQQAPAAAPARRSP